MDLMQERIIGRDCRSSWSYRLEHIIFVQMELLLQEIRQRTLILFLKKINRKSTLSSSREPRRRRGAHPGCNESDRAYRPCL